MRRTLNRGRNRAAFALVAPSARQPSPISGRHSSLTAHCLLHGRVSSSVSARCRLSRRILLVPPRPAKGLSDAAAVRRRIDGARHDDRRRQGPARVHDLQGAAAPGAAVARVAAPGSRDPRHRGSALLRARRHRRRSASPARRVNNVLEGRAAQGGSTHHAAARASELPHARQDDSPQDAGDRRSPRGSSGTFTKDEILELYLNKVYFGDGLYGVEAASLGYFGKHASELNVREAALLAGLVEVAVHVCADREPRARASRGATSCCGRCATPASSTSATYQAGRQAPVRLNDTLRREEAFGQYFKEEVRKQLVERFGWERVYQGGLQGRHDARPRHAEGGGSRGRARARRHRAAAGGADARRSAAMDPLQAALVALDPATGEVRAMVGGREFERQPLQPRDAGAAAAGLGLQAVRLCRGARARLHAGHADHGPQRAGDDAAGRMGSRGRACRRATRSRCGRRCARRAIARPCGCCRPVGIPAAVRYAERLGVGIGAERAVAGARFGRGDAAVDDVGVRRVCERGRARRRRR